MSDRFVVEKEKTGLMRSVRIIVDQKTGVNYLFYGEAQAGGLCPLLDRDGKPIITPIAY